MTDSNILCMDKVIIRLQYIISFVFTYFFSFIHLLLATTFTLCVLQVPNDQITRRQCACFAYFYFYLNVVFHLLMMLVLRRLTCGMVLEKGMGPWREREGRPFFGSRQHDLFNRKRKEDQQYCYVGKKVIKDIDIGTDCISIHQIRYGKVERNFLVRPEQEGTKGRYTYTITKLAIYYTNI